MIALAAEEKLGWDDAIALVGSWNGDSFVGWRRGDEHCILAAVEFDGAASARTFVIAVGGTSTGAMVTLESCG